jgi:pimeloyl-ACP methyl ester carboxylesterase
MRGAVKRALRVRCAAVVAAVVVSASAQETARTTRGTLPDGTAYRIDYPQNFNGTVLVGLDYAASPAEAPAPRALLTRGYGMAGTTRLVTGWSVADAVANQVATLDVVERTYGRPRFAVVYGSSLGGHVGAAVVQARPDRFSGAMLACGGHAGTVAMWNAKFDALWIAKTLIAPTDGALPVVDVPADFATTARPAWIARLTAAQKTPEGRARIALAAVIAQLPTWSVPSKPQPGPDDIAGLQEGLFDSLAGGSLPLAGQAMSSRFEINRRAGGNISSNEGVDYAALLGQMRLAPLVRTLYRQAGLDLEADLATLARALRVKADPAAVAWTAPGNWTGRVTIPVLTLNAVGDQISMVSGERFYQEAADAAGFGANVRHLYVNGAGHCPFTPGEHVAAIDLLVTRLETGRWPETSPAAAAARARQLGLEPTRFIDYQPEPLARPFRPSGSGPSPQTGR